MFEIGAAQWPGLSKLAEEAGEVLQVIGKLMGNRGERAHWDGAGDLQERLEDEIADVMAACHFVISHCKLDTKPIVARMERKIALFGKWHNEQRLKDDQ